MYLSCALDANVYSKYSTGVLCTFIDMVLLQPLRWCCVDCVIRHERDVPEEQHRTYMWREQAIIE